MKSGSILSPAWSGVIAIAKDYRDCNAVIRMQ